MRRARAFPSDPRRDHAGESISGGRESIESKLKRVQGYGTLLSSLRGTRSERLARYVLPTWRTGAYDRDRAELERAVACFDWVRDALGGEGPGKLDDLLQTSLALARALGASGEPRSEPGEPASPDDLQARLQRLAGDASLRLTDDKGWFLFDGRSPPPRLAGELVPSMLGTKLDYLWEALDTASHLENVTRRYRYFDGYHFLATLADLRVTSKDTRPQVSLPVIELVFDLFLASIEGIIAQLAWCLELAGHRDLASAIRPATVVVRPPDGFVPPDVDLLERVLRVRVTDGVPEVFTLGIPGKDTVGRFYFHHQGDVHKL